jgi:hypothetical protein
MTSQESTPRLAVVAAIIATDVEGSDGEGGDPEPHCSSVLAARITGPTCSALVPSLSASATGVERALAEALCVDHDQGPAAKSQEPVLAELLLLAAALPESGKLAAALSETFLPPDDSVPAPARRDRTSVFADLYRRLALAQLNNQVRNKVAAALGRLRGSRGTGGPSLVACSSPPARNTGPLDPAPTKGPRRAGALPSGPQHWPVRPGTEGSTGDLRAAAPPTRHRLPGLGSGS